MNKESTQKEVLQAIKDINISAEIGDITVESSDTITHSKLDTLNTTVSNKHLNSTTDSVNIGNFPSTQPISGSVSVSNLPATQAVSGSVSVSNLPATQAVSGSVSITNSSIPVTGTFFQETQPISGSVSVSNFPTDTAKEAKQDTQIEELQKIVNKTGDITANIPYSQGPSVWADSQPIPIENPNGWIYVNAEAGNAMNLFYFNGNNGETKTLNQVVGQYAVVSNLSTEVNNKLIFAVYTKGSPFFTTRITHSSPSSMVAGGKYLLYWGSVDADIYPNLPRLNFSVITTTGPAVGTEEILSVSLNSDTSATAGSIFILIQSLGVVFSDGSVNQSRVYNLITENTESETLNNIQQTLLSINGKINTIDGGINSYIINYPASQTINGEVSVSSLPAIEITNTGFDINNQISNYALEADGNLEEIRNKTDNFNFNDNSGVLELNVFDIQSNVKLDSIETYTSKLDDLTYTDNNLNVNVAAGSLSVDSVKIKASNGDDLTATTLITGKSGLDTASNMFGFDGSTRTAITCDSGGKMNVRSHNTDYLGNGITSTTTSISGGATNSLDTSSSLYVSNGNARTALTATGSSLNANITNTVPVSGTVAFSNTSIQVSNLPATQPISGSVSVSNLPATQPISGSVSVSNLPATQAVSGTVGVSNSFTLDTTTQSSNTKLDTIHADLDGLTFDGSSNLNVNVNAGSISVSSVNIKDSAGNNLNSTSNALNSYITNSSIDVHNKVKHNTNWVDLVGASNGHLLVNSSTQDGDGTDITSTFVANPGGDKQGLDVFVANITQSRVFTDLGNATGTDITATRVALDTASSLYTADGTTRNALTSTAISSIRALDVNVANSGAIPVAFSNTSIGISGTVATDDSTGNGYLNTINQGVGYSYIEATALSNVSIAGAGTATYYNWTRGQYKDRAVFYYQDGATANTDSVSLFTKETPSGNAVLLGTFYPYIIGATRNYSGNINLLPFNTISVRNNSASTITGVSLKIFSA
jgi:hypothetical protein